MNKTPTLITFIISCLLLPAIASARKDESLQPKAGSYAKAGAKVRRLNLSDEPSILFEYDENVPEGIRNAFDKARLLWESKLVIRKPFSLHVVMDYLENNYPMEVEVSQIEDGPMRGCPLSLAQQFSDYNYIEGPVSIIVLNNDVDWNYNTDAVIFNGYDAYTVGLRAIAISLGIGTSLTYIDETSDFGIDYSFEYPNYFDRIIHDGYRTFLTDYENRSVEMKNFVTCGNLFAEGIDYDCPLYSPYTFEPWRSLVYLELDDSLMSVYFWDENYIRDIDIYTIDILKKIGWEIEEGEPHIIYDGGESVKNINAYLSHSFQLTGVEYESCMWELKIKNNTGEFTTIDSSENNIYSPKIMDINEDIMVDKGGFAEISIECKYNTNGNLRKAPPLNLSLDLKPVIVSVDNYEIIKTAPYYHHAKFDLRSLGGTNIYVDIEEEYSSARIRKTYDYKENISVSTSDASALYYSWIYIIVRNKYGETEKIIEIEPSIN